MAGTIQANEIVFALVNKQVKILAYPLHQHLIFCAVLVAISAKPFNFTQSNEVDATRQGAEQIKIGQPVEGSLEGEMPIADPIMHTFD